ncbi:MAG: response regulator [Desulfocapsa sp.]|nr:response regulator [Desulfocapsa sp.]
MSNKKILVVDDSPTLLKMTISVLEETQLYEIVTAVDGVDALQKVISFKPDLVLLDVVMPKMDGFQVCRKLKAFPKTKHIPVILLTSKSQKVDKFWGKKQGADMYLTKPFDKENLLDAVRKSLA